MADGSAPPPPPKWYYQPSSVVLLLFFVLGPFGLPLLWKSPAFSRGMKIANLFVAHSELVQLKALRSRPWGTTSLWGRVLTYRTER